MGKLSVVACVLAALAIGSSASAQTLDPEASGTIRNLPELRVFDLAPVGSDVQSTYFRTTAENREFRRGMAEFAIPSGPILSATLVLAEWRATVSAPVPPDVHHVTSYTPADRAVTTADYDRAGTAVGTFSTDANLETQTFTFDVSALVAAVAGGTIGFRVQLADDPERVDFLPAGSQFRVTLGIVTPEPLAMGFEFDPDVLVLGARGHWVAGHLEPAPPLAAADIEVASIRLNGSVPVDVGAPTTLGDHDGDGIAELAVKFARQAVEGTVSQGDDVAVTVTGTLGGQSFSGTDHIRVRSRDSGPPPDSLPPLTLALRGPKPISGADGQLRVAFTLRDGSPARVELLDVAGRSVLSRPVGHLGPGVHSLVISNGQAMAPGVYFLRLTQDGRQAWTRAVVLRH